MTGWTSLPFVEPDGENWPLSFAATMLGVPETQLRRQVKKEQIEPAGVIRMAGFRRSGRQPAAYPAQKLIMIAESMRPAQENGKE